MSEKKRYLYRNSEGSEHILSLPENEERWGTVVVTTDGRIWHMTGRDAALLMLGESSAPGVESTKQIYIFIQELEPAGEGI